MPTQTPIQAGTYWTNHHGWIYQVIDVHRFQEKGKKDLLRARAQNLRTGSYDTLHEDDFKILSALSPEESLEIRAWQYGEHTQSSPSRTESKKEEHWLEAVARRNREQFLDSAPTGSQFRNCALPDEDW
jgi:hypothetical protein